MMGEEAGKETNTATRPVPLSEITSSQDQRIGTGMEELDRVLGGGIVTGSLVLVGGDPGIGNLRCFCRFVRSFRRGIYRFCMSPARSLSSR